MRAMAASGISSGRILTGALLVLTGLTLQPVSVTAGPVLLANEVRPFGLAVGGMAGAQTAAAGSVDALWANPAGLAKEPRSELYLDAGTLDSTELTVGGAGNSSIASSPGALGWVSGPTRARPRYGFGFFLHTPTWQSESTRLDESRVVGGAGIPAPVAGGIAYDSLFPGGIQRNEHGAGTGSLSVVAPGFGLGVRVFDWLRVGTSLRLERVSLRMQEDFTQDYAATNSTGGSNLLKGVTQSSAQFAGEANRAIWTLGLQMDLGNQVILGIVSRQPSQQIGGIGQARVDRLDTVQVTQNGLQVQQATSFIHMDKDHIPFKLRDPGSVRVGAAFLFDTLVVEVDLEQTRPLAPYEVFPRLESSPPSTTSAQQPALTTRARGVTSYAIGAAFAQGNQGSWFFGFATDPSPVAGNDPIFRKVDFNRVTSGFYATRGSLSGAVRLSYATANSPAVQFPHVSDDDAVVKPVRITVWSLGLSGSYVY